MTENWVVMNCDGRCQLIRCQIAQEVQAGASLHFAGRGLGPGVRGWMPALGKHGALHQTGGSAGGGLGSGDTPEDTGTRAELPSVDWFILA